MKNYFLTLIQLKEPKNPSQLILNHENFFIIVKKVSMIKKVVY